MKKTISFVSTIIPADQFKKKYEIGSSDKSETITIYHLGEVLDSEIGAYRCYECSIPTSLFDEDEVKAAYAKFDERVKAAELAYAISKKEEEITAYDKSPAVNAFYLNGEQHWLDFNLRDRVFDGNERIAYKGREETSLWLDGKCFVMPIAVAQDLICTIEVYAKDCYNVTATHQAEVNKLTTIEEVEAYNYKTGYPEKLNLKV